jgi:hypothetical protein
MNPQPGEIWIKIREDRDPHNKIGDRVRITPHPGESRAGVTWNYIPDVKTVTSKHKPYQNGWTLDNFLKYYQRDEAYEVERLLKEYESTTRRDLD